MTDVFKHILAPRNVKKNAPVVVLFIISLIILAYHQYTSSSFSLLDINTSTSTPHHASPDFKPHLNGNGNNNAAFAAVDSGGARAIRDARKHHSYHRAKRPVRLPAEGEVHDEPKAAPSPVPVPEEGKVAV